MGDDTTWIIADRMTRCYPSSSLPLRSASKVVTMSSTHALDNSSVFSFPVDGKSVDWTVRRIRGTRSFTGKSFASRSCRSTVNLPPKTAVFVRTPADKAPGQRNRETKSRKMAQNGGEVVMKYPLKRKEKRKGKSVRRFRRRGRELI